MFAHYCTNWMLLILDPSLILTCIFFISHFAHLLILPFSVFPLYAHTSLVKGHFLMLRRQSGTLFLTKSGHPTPSHPSNHHLKLIFFSRKTDKIISGEQAGFRAGRSTTEQIFNPRILCEKYLQHQQELYHVFIDLRGLSTGFGMQFCVQA